MEEKPKKINRARVEISGDRTMERHYDESGTLFKETREDSIDYFYTKGPLKGKLKERTVSEKDKENTYSGTGVLEKSFFDDERTEYYTGLLKGKTKLKDGTIIDTPKATELTPDEGASKETPTKGDGDYINPADGSTEHYFDGKMYKKDFPDGREQYFKDGVMYKEELPKKKPTTTEKPGEETIS